MLKRITALFLALALCLLNAACAAGGATGESVASEPETDASSTASPTFPQESGGSSEAAAEPQPDRVALADEPVATRGEDSVSVLDFTYQFFNIDNQYRSYIGMGVMDLEAQQPGTLASAQEDALTYAKEFTLLHKEALSKGAALTEEEIAQLKTFVDTEVETQGGEQAFLNAYMFTPEQFFELMQRYQLVSNYYQDCLEAIIIPEEELRAAYDESAGTYDQVTVRHVLIQPYDPATATAPEEGREAVTDEEAAAKADDILAQLNGGADMTALAAEHSEDPGSKDSGGLYTFGMGQMVAEFEGWSFDSARKEGDTGIVKSTHGYHVMQFVSRTGYEEALPAIESELKTAKFDADHTAIDEAISAEDWVINEEVMQKPFAQ
ncbi:MAG: peptidylprolyl isomerase [Oscillospiraceae bacterium]|nr:peptidylprolyl isomerase [Oscillospiraceae bacterium]